MISKTAIEDALALWVEANSSLKAVIADQDAPQPETPFCEIRVQNQSRMGWDETRSPNDEGVAIIRGNREVMVYLQGMRTGAYDELIALQDSLEKDSVHAFFVEKGFIYVETEPVLNLTRTEQQNFVERASLDIRFRTGVDVEDSVGLISKVVIDATAKIENVEIETEISIGTAYTP